MQFDRNNKKRYNHTFSTSIYRKSTFTGLHTKWDSFTPRKYKVNLTRTLTFRCFRICSSPSLLRSCLDELRKLLLQNGYPAGVINYDINDVSNRQQNRPRNPTTPVPKNETILVLPYLGAQSKIFTNHLKTCINRFYGCIDLRVIFQSAHRIKSFFPYKNKINRSQMSKARLLSSCLNWKIYCDDHTSIHLQLQYKYELFHIYFT